MPTRTLGPERGGGGWIVRIDGGHACQQGRMVPKGGGL